MINFDCKLGSGTSSYKFRRMVSATADVLFLAYMRRRGLQQIKVLGDSMRVAKAIQSLTDRFSLGSRDLASGVLYQVGEPSKDGFPLWFSFILYSNVSLQWLCESEWMVIHISVISKATQQVRKSLPNHSNLRGKPNVSWLASANVVRVALYAKKIKLLL